MSPSDYRKELTAKIIQQLEAGTAPWIKPWDPSMSAPGTPHNGVSGREYHGGNALWLSCQGYADPRWCTYKQATEQGWQVQKGERSTLVEYWNWTENRKDEHGKSVEVKLDQPRVFYASVFNVSQMENVPEYKPEARAWEPLEEAERILSASGARIYYNKQDTAYYSPRSDSIHMPPRSLFPDPRSFYATALHELGHWTGHQDRLNRELVSKFGTAEYAKEELRADLASYFVSARLGLPHDPGQHAAYVGSWIQALQQDHNEIHRAARDAEKICEFVLQFQLEKSQIKEQSHEQPSQTATPSPTAQPSRRQREKEVELEC
jgi:antirestriction protein ArdC